MVSMESEPRITYLFVEAALELVPQELLGSRDVIASARRRSVDPSKMLLDISYHYRSMRRHLANWYKRGRPDIIHTSLLLLSSSPLWSLGIVNAVIETRHGLVHVRSEVRIPRNYNRFVSLMEQVLVRGSAPPDSEKPLIYLVRKDLLEYLRELSPEYSVLLDEKGRREDPVSLCRRIASSKRSIILVGGFQRGDFSQRILSLGLERVSIYGESLDTWAVVCKINSILENLLGIF
jgi:rRNA small subunit pseudouridine methyltransferase Nep1